MIRSVLLAILAVISGSVAFAADPFFFLQASDPQFGMFTNNAGFAQETANWEFVIANANRLKPRFVVVTGDLTNQAGNATQIAEYRRINKKLDAAVHLYSVAGNHDVGNDPTPVTLAAYRSAFGKDYYSFREGNIHGIVLNSSLMKAPGEVAEEAAGQEKWLEGELAAAKAAGAEPVVFQHIPYFLASADEPDQYFNLPMATRLRILRMLKKYGVRYVFAGHYHRNAYGKDGDLEMITTGPAGMPLGPDPSGFRLVEWKDRVLAQLYFGLGTLPNIFPFPNKK